VEATGTLRFTADELEGALALRTSLSADGDPAAVVATVEGDDARVRVTVIGRERWVSLDDQRGRDAARLVAFAILDLAGDQLDPPARPAPRVAAVTPPMPPPVDALHVETSTLAPVRDVAPSWAIALWGTSGSRNAAALEIDVGVHGPLRAIATTGVSARTEHQRDAASVALRTMPVRVGLGWRSSTGRAGPFEARVTAVAQVEHAAAARSETGVVLGGGASLVWVARSVGERHGAAFLAGGGIDGFITARDYRVDGAAVVASDRVAWWCGIAVAAELDRRPR
jgi:hypothetical protein